MKRWKIIFLLLTVAAFSWLQTTSANSPVPPLGFSGGPGDQNCTACHNSFPLNSGKGSLILSGIPFEFQPGETYNLTLTIQDPDAQRWGFEVVAVNDKGQNVGKLSITQDTFTELRSNNGRDYIVPTIAGNFTGQKETASWQFNWIAPTQGSVVFYFAAVAGDLDATPRGDRVYTSSMSSRLFQARPPTLNFVTPGNGSAAGNTKVLLGGENYRSGAKVFFDDIEAMQTKNDGITIEVLTPPHVPGVVDIKIANPDGTNAVFPGTFVYDPLPSPKPQLFVLSPSQGPTAGGTVTKLNGIDFQPGARALVDGKEVPTRYIDTSFLSITTPLHNPGPVPVTVINPDGQTVVLKDAFVYEGAVPPPVVKLLNPSGGVLSAGGANVTINWTIESNGSATQRLLLSTDGGNSFPILLASGLTADITQFHFTIPEDIVTDQARIRLEAIQPEGTGFDVSDKDIKIVTAPQIDKITPATTKAGKTKLTVEIKGKNFTQGSTVELNGVKLKVVSASSTTIKLKKVPHTTAGGFFLKVRNPNGGVSRNFIFTIAQ